MTTISPNRRRLRIRSRLLVLLGLIVLAVAVFLFARSTLASLLWRGVAPLVNLEHAGAASLGYFFESVSSGYQLAQENAHLREELVLARALAADRAYLLAENTDLKTRLLRSTPRDVARTLALVVARPPASPYDTLIIDVGEDKGVAPGDLVSAGGSLFVGTVGEVYATTARVVLFSSPEEVHQALLIHAGTSTLAVSVMGQGGGSLMSEVPSGVGAVAGDMVVFSSLTPRIMGTVVFVDEKEGASFKKIYIQLPVNMHELRYVEVYHQ